MQCFGLLVLNKEGIEWRVYTHAFPSTHHDDQGAVCGQAPDLVAPQLFFVVPLANRCDVMTVVNVTEHTAGVDFNKKNLWCTVSLIES